MKQNILELIDSFRTGGTERQAIQLARMLRQDGRFQVFVGCLDRSGDLLEEVTWVRHEEIPEYRLNSFYDANFFRQAMRCARFIRQKKIQLIHTHDFYSNIFGMTAGLLAGCVRIASKRNTFSFSAKQSFVERQAFRLAHRIVTNANTIGALLAGQGVPAGKLVTIYNGVDVSKFGEEKLDPASISTWRDKFPQFGNKRIVTILANLRSENKNHRMFIRSAKLVLRATDNVAFAIAGEGKLSEPIQTYASELGVADKIHFMGLCPDPKLLLKNSDVGVLCSYSEGFSNVLLEYMAAGIPVVATNVGGAAELIRHGSNGFLVEPDDDEAMAEHISKLLEDPIDASKMGNNGMRLVKDKFSAAAQLESVLALYESAIREFGRSPE